MTKKHAIEYVLGLQEVQKRNPPTSVEWLRASKELHVMYRKLAAGEFEDSENV